MYTGKVRYRDAAVANILSAGSVLAEHVPPIARAMGTIHSISGEPIQWRRARGTYANPRVGREWVSYGGNVKSGRTPAHYREAAVFIFDKQLADEMSEEYLAKHAIAYVLGETAVMIGTASSGELFGIDPTDESQYAVAMRIGKGTLQAMPGIATSSRVFYPLRYADISVIRQPLSQVGPSIPIV